MSAFDRIEQFGDVHLIAVQAVAVARAAEIRSA